MEYYRDNLGCRIASAAVDNAAEHVAAQSLELYRSRNPKHPRPLLTRDPAHCLDLIAKDLNKTPCFKEYIEQRNALVTLLTTDNIVGICQKVVAKQPNLSFHHVVKKADTRFFGSYDEAESIHKNRELLKALDTTPEFEEYYNSRKKASRRTTLDNTFGYVTHKFWHMNRFFMSIILALCSDKNTPMTAYYPICHVTKESMEMVLQPETNTNELFGDGAFKELTALIEYRFNMDGKSPG